MIRLRTFLVFTLLAMLFTALAPQALASWVCEGRTCGIATQTCCCFAAAAARDPRCGNPRPVKSGTSVCSSQCKCVLSSSILDSASTTQPIVQAVAAELPGLLPNAFEYHLPAPAVELPHQGEGRGPPPALRCFATPALRGPPSLTRSINGF
jgi:hypothetical protein